MKTIRLRIDCWVSPMGPLLVATDQDGVLRGIEFGDDESGIEQALRNQYPGCTLEHGEAPAALRNALKAYFDGNLDALANVRTATGGTAFQREVWQALREIPPGTTVSYGQLAAKLGRARASRAVGAANGANPIPIVVPCHRVIGADGSLTGFGGGLRNKKWLLDHEARFASLSCGAAKARYLL